LSQLQLPREVKLDPIRYADALIRKFGQKKTRETWVAEFRQLKQNNGENVGDFFDRVQHIATKAFPHICGLGRSEEGQFEIVHQQFIAGLRQVPIRRGLMQLKPQTLDDLRDCSVELEGAEINLGGVDVRSPKGSANVAKTESDDEEVEGAQYFQGPSTSKSKSKAEGQKKGTNNFKSGPKSEKSEVSEHKDQKKGPKPRKKCTVCHKLGHEAANCYKVVGYPQNHASNNAGAANSGQQAPRVCFRCGRSGHVAASCAWETHLNGTQLGPNPRLHGSGTAQVAVASPSIPSVPYNPISALSAQGTNAATKSTQSAVHLNANRGTRDTSALLYPLTRPSWS
jgi:hypothetical protein